MAVTEIKNESVIEKDIEKAIKDRLFIISRCYLYKATVDG